MVRNWVTARTNFELPRTLAGSLIAPDVVLLAELADRAAVHMAVFDRQIVMQFADLIARFWVIQDVKKHVDFPRIRVTEIGLTYDPAGPLTKEADGAQKIAREAPRRVARYRRPMLGNCAQKPDWNVFVSGCRQPSPESDKEERHRVHSATLITLDERQNMRL